WDLRVDGPRVRRPPTEEETAFFGGPSGPRVLQGTYTIRLALGDKTVEKKVEVRLDPTISVSNADLQEQYNDAIKLRDMQSTLTDGARLLDSVKEQLQNIEKTVKDRLPDAPKELTEAIANGQKQVDEVLKNLFSQQEQGLGLSGSAQLGEKIGGLGRTIDSVNAAPTPAQRDYFSELQKEFPTRVAEVNRFITETIPRLNETLRKYNAPTVMGGKPLDAAK